MAEVMLMYIHIAHAYKYGSLKRVRRQASKIEIVSLSSFLSLISPITLRFNSGCFCVPSDEARVEVSE